MPSLLNDYRNATGNIGGQIGNFVGGVGGSLFGGPGGSFLGGLIGRGLGSLVETGGASLGHLFGTGLRMLPQFGGGQGSSNAATPSTPTPTQIPQSPQARNWGNVFNTGRFTNAPGFFTTLAQAQFPGSMIGPLGGGNMNPYNSSAPSASARGGSHSGTFGSTQAFQNYVASHTQK